MKKRLFVVIIALVATMNAQRAMAWGWTGHDLTAYIAEKHLTPEAKAKCRHYLKHTLPYYSWWMDSWRGVEKFEAANNPHSIRATDDCRRLAWSEEDKPVGRIMGHFVSALDELGGGKYKNLPDSVVRQRLINMIHYVGDMHCPVHIKYPQDKYPNPTIYRKGKRANFHSFWDASVNYQRGKWTLEEFAEKIDNVSPKQVKRWQKGTLDDWGTECVRRGLLAFELTPEGTDLAKLSDKQVAEIHKLAEETILVGAYRLAYILNTIFAE